MIKLLWELSSALLRTPFSLETPPNSNYPIFRVSPREEQLSSCLLQTKSYKFQLPVDYSMYYFHVISMDVFQILSSYYFTVTECSYCMDLSSIVITVVLCTEHG